MAEITIKYDGKWPNLCSGHLIVDIDGKTKDMISEKEGYAVEVVVVLMKTIIAKSNTGLGL